MPAKRKTRKPKQVVYLWGAGGTQAEIDYIGAPRINLLMRDSDSGVGICSRILKRAARKWGPFLKEDNGVDIEKLISLMSSSGLDSLCNLAEDMRHHYFDEICKSIVGTRLITSPDLALALLEMHNDRTFRESVEVLSGVVTTNHDGLLQVASQKVFGRANLGFPYVSDACVPPGSDEVPLILQLHGSFTWTFGVPIQVSPLKKGVRYSTNAVWIPPAILKESKNYPFNKLTGLAHELLCRHCDVLRVVGSSLTQNDWNILSLIFNAQRHRESMKGAAFRIELIMSHRGGERVKAECSYLKNVTPIGYLSEGNFAEYKEGPPPPESDMKNSLAYWLKEKIAYHRRAREFAPGELPDAMQKIVGAI